MTKQTVIAELGQMGWKFIGNGTWAKIDGKYISLYAYSDSTDTWTGTMTGPGMQSTIVRGPGLPMGDYVAPGMTHENMMWDLEQWVICCGIE